MTLEMLCSKYMEIRLVISLNALGCSSQIWNKWDTDGFWAKGANLLKFVKFSQKIKQNWWQINNGPGAVDEKEFRPPLPPLHQLLIWFLAFGFGSTAFLLHHHHYCLNWTVLQTGVAEISSEISRNRESNLIWQNIHTLIRGDANNMIKIFVATCFSFQ